MTPKSELQRPSRFDTKVHQLLVVIILALGPPIGTVIAMLGFDVSFIPAAMGAIVVTVSIAFPVYWLWTTLQRR